MGTNLMNGTHLHVRCMAHIMNLVVQDGLKESSVSIERVRHAVRYVRQSPARLKRFQECFDAEQLNSKKTSCLDVPSRWNSTYLMLRRAIEFECAFSHYASSEIGLRHYLEHSYIDVGIPTVAVYLKQLIANEDIVLSEMAKNMKEKFDKYWGDPGKMNKIIFISCILDPRYKIESVGFALVKMFGVDPGATIQAEVTKYMTSLFSEYVKSSSKGVVLASSSDCSSLDTSTSGLSGNQISILAEKARDILVVPVSSVESECAFSTGGRLLDSFRSSLTPKLVQALVCLQDWLRNEKLKQPISVEEDLDKIEQIEQDLANNGKDPSSVVLVLVRNICCKQHKKSNSEEPFWLSNNIWLKLLHFCDLHFLLVIWEDLLELQDEKLTSTMREQQQRALEFWELH
ncbi:zinc finger BED domain-containing protein RICESLEEPER 2-like [Nicotiana sylvestris]|uniref:zinc finger BED domain-containing protein RICESLEEPER 2-like n=1 Tax=Nicotiana sylvestris TaxID=4096 RepID=UPI00388CA878